MGASLVAQKASREKEAALALELSRANGPLIFCQPELLFLWFRCLYCLDFPMTPIASCPSPGGASSGATAEPC